MGIQFLKIILFAGLILFFFGLIKFFSFISKGRIVADWFAAINLFLYFGLIANLLAIYFLDTWMPGITCLVILGGLIYRNKKLNRWL